MTSATAPYRHQTISRRALLNQAAALTGISVAAALLGACGGSASPTTAPTTGAAASPTTGAAASTTAGATATRAATGAASSATTGTAPAASNAAGTRPTGSAVSGATAPSGSVVSGTTSAASGTAQDATPKIVTAANAFLATLTDAQRTSVSFAYPSDQKTATAANFSGRVGEQFGVSVWSNYPISDVIRPGLRMGDLTDVQRQAAMALLAATLSQRGYQKVLDIRNADQVLSDSGTQYQSGTANYVLGLFGTPSTSARWMVQFGGHHLGLNVTMQGAAQTLAPMLTGCQPSAYTMQGQTIRPLGAETDKGFALINALDATQQKQAILSYAVTDLVLGPGHDGQVLQPEGIPAANMNASQQALLLDLVGEWVNILNDAAAQARMAAIKTRLAETYFAWSGATTSGSVVYFRVTGPTLLIEFSHQGAGGGGPGGGPGGGQQSGVQAGGVNHIHTIYRDPTNNYGTGLGQ